MNSDEQNNSLLKDVRHGEEPSQQRLTEAREDADAVNAGRGLSTAARANGFDHSGPSFETPNGAARDAIARFNPRSIASGLEFGGTIYKEADTGKYRYALPPNVQNPAIRGGHVSTAQGIPTNATEIGRWHTHGKTENYSDEDFSVADLDLAYGRSLRSWLGTPKGALKLAVPVRGGVVIIDLVTTENTRPNIRFQVYGTP